MNAVALKGIQEIGNLSSLGRREQVDDQRGRGEQSAEVTTPVKKGVITTEEETNYQKEGTLPC